jgi:hypothetical protein
MNISSFPQNAMIHFLEMINTYGSVLSQRSTIKLLDSNLESGLFDSNKSVIFLQKDSMLDQHISTQKYLKKLKHKLQERFPEHFDNMMVALSEHKQVHENANRLRYANFDKMSDAASSIFKFFLRFNENNTPKYSFKRYVISMITPDHLRRLKAFKPSLKNTSDVAALIEEMDTLLLFCTLDNFKSFAPSDVIDVSNDTNNELRLKIAIEEHNKYSKCIEKYNVALKKYNEVHFKL